MFNAGDSSSVTIWHQFSTALTERQSAIGITQTPLILDASSRTANTLAYVQKSNVDTLRAGLYGLIVGTATASFVDSSSYTAISDVSSLLTKAGDSTNVWINIASTSIPIAISETKVLDQIKNCFNYLKIFQKKVNSDTSSGAVLGGFPIGNGNRDYLSGFYDYRTCWDNAKIAAMTTPTNPSIQWSVVANNGTWNEGSLWGPKCYWQFTIPSITGTIQKQFATIGGSVDVSPFSSWSLQDGYSNSFTMNYTGTHEYDIGNHYSIGTYLYSLEILTSEPSGASLPTFAGYKDYTIRAYCTLMRFISDISSSLTYG